MKSKVAQNSFLHRNKTFKDKFIKQIFRFFEGKLKIGLKTKIFQLFDLQNVDPWKIDLIEDKQTSNLAPFSGDT